jgi:hypothetical protein
VYYDRLVDVTDRKWLFELLHKVVKQGFKEDFEALFKHLASPGQAVKDDDMRSLLFGDYTKPDAVSEGGREGGREGEREGGKCVSNTVYRMRSCMKKWRVWMN